MWPMYIHLCIVLYDPTSDIDKGGGGDVLHL